ncbi:MAG TPA: TonB-dependent receptor [Flavisolibacter sp.]|nr:TonB-dependent receptor [Flavisolibacter sp.]
MIRRVLPLFMALLFAQVINAQFSISGTIRDQQAASPLSGASVRLSSVSNGAIARNVLSDSLGRFSFQNLPADSFQVAISFVGFKDVTRGVRVDSTTASFDAAGTGMITLDVAMAPSSSNDLATVVISTRIAPATQKGDTLQINASQFKVNPDATAEDLARKVPGITIENGQVKAQGENVQKVTIDGRELFGDDATAALRNLPAEIIDKIQIFDRMSDQAQLSGVDDGNTQKGINIVTKANMRNGQFGRITAGYGTDERYLAGGNTTFLKDNRRISIVGNFNNVNQQNFSQQDLLGVTSSGGRGGGGGGFRGGGGGPRGGGNWGGGGAGNFMVGTQNGINRTNALGINFSDVWGKKLTVTGSYLFNDSKNTTRQLASTQYFTNSITNIVDTTASVSNNQNHRVNLRFEYRIDSMNQLIITPSANIQHNNANRSVGTATFFSPNNPFVQTLNTNVNDDKRNATNLNNSILYRRSFAKRGRAFTINLNTSYNERTGEAYVNTFQRSFASGGFDDTLSNRFTDQASNTFQVSTNITYSEPLGQNSQLQFSYNPRIAKSKSDQQTFEQDPMDNKYSLFRANLSNVLENTTTAQNGGLSYRWGDRDRMISFGVNYQNTNLKSNQTFPQAVTVNKSFSNVLPNAMIRYKISTRSNLRLFYRTNVNEPSVTQLQSVIDIANAPVYRIGNVNLNTQYTQFGSFQYTYTNPTKGLLLVGNLFYQTAKDYISNATYTLVRDTVVGGVTLSPGSRLTTPVNLDGYRNMRSMITFAVPVGFIKSNLNLDAGISYTQTPGITNSRLNETKSTVYTLRSGIASNVSQYVDFNVSYSANFNKVRNQVLPTANNDFFQHVASLQFNLLSKNGWFFQNDVNNQFYNGLSEGFNQNYVLWNMSAGKKILKDRKGEIKVSVFDLLKQNQSISRNITGEYIEDVQNQVLQQYFMLHFTYNLRNFGTAAARQQNRAERQGGNQGPPRF